MIDHPARLRTAAAAPGGFPASLAAAGIALLWCSVVAGAAATTSPRVRTERSSSQFPDQPAEALALYETDIEHWADGPVQYLMLRQERDEWSHLDTTEAKQRFIEAFWSRRDPDLRDAINPFELRFYQRVAEANDRFSGVPRGWRSDRGRVWVMLGRPDSMRREQGNRGNELSTWIYHAPGISPALSDIPDELHVRFFKTRRGWEALDDFGQAGGFPNALLDVFERIRKAAIQDREPQGPVREIPRAPATGGPRPRYWTISSNSTSKISVEPGPKGAPGGTLSPYASSAGT